MFNTTQPNLKARFHRPQISICHVDPVQPHPRWRADLMAPPWKLGKCQVETCQQKCGFSCCWFFLEKGRREHSSKKLELAWIVASSRKLKKMKWPSPKSFRIWFSSIKRWGRKKNNDTHATYARILRLAHWSGKLNWKPSARLKGTPLKGKENMIAHFIVL